MVRLADLLRAAGAAHSPGGQDTELVHVNKREKALLKAMGGAGAINPVTGMKQYYTDGGMSDEGTAGNDFGDGAGPSWSDEGGWTWGGDYGESAGYTDPDDDNDGTPNWAEQQYMDENSPDVAPASPAAQAAISNWQNDPDAWAGQFGNVMDGLPDGMLSDFADWASRNGLYSQPGAGQVGAFDFLGNILGDRHDLQANPLQTWITQNGLQGLTNVGVPLAGALLGIPGLSLGFNALKGDNIFGQGVTTLAGLFGGPQAGLTAGAINNIANDRPGSALTSLIGSQVPGLSGLAGITGLNGFLNNAINNAPGTGVTYTNDGDSAYEASDMAMQSGGGYSAYGSPIGGGGGMTGSAGSTGSGFVPTSATNTTAYQQPFAPTISQSSYSRPRRLGEMFRS